MTKRIFARNWEDPRLGPQENGRLAVGVRYRTYGGNCRIWRRWTAVADDWDAVIEDAIDHVRGFQAVMRIDGGDVSPAKNLA